MNHFVVLLGAYGVTLSTSGETRNLKVAVFVCLLPVFPFSYIFLFFADQKILMLLQEYERNDVSLLKFQ